MLYCGSFDIHGNMTAPSPYMSVYRKGDMLVIEFINNVIVAFRFKSEGIDRYSCYVRKFRLFEDYVYESDLFNVKLDGWLMSAVSVDIALSVGDVNLPRLTVQIVAETNGKTSFFPYSRMDYPADSMVRWWKCNGVVIPEGCTAGIGPYYSSPGYSITCETARFIVNFPNGLHFPMRRYDNGVDVLGTMFVFSPAALKGVFVRVRKKTVQSVCFRVVFYTTEGVFVADNIKYTLKFVSFNGKSMRVSAVTKSLVLGG